ncbi:MAG: beta galactosidase jelly roll domain-containing protein [Cyclobacteriaceae bacterium]
MKRKYIVTLCAALIFNLVNAQLKLPKLISDGVILQRDAKLTIWGWDSPKQKINITFQGAQFSATTNENGYWSVDLKSYPAGGPYVMQIEGSSEVVINDILMGDVWLCSGQSNMELTMQRTSPIYQREITESANTNIRQFEVPDRFNFKVRQDTLSGGSWVSAHPSTIRSFTAVGYFFADSLNKALDVPIGLINAALGGSPAQAWMSEKALQKYPHYLSEMRQFQNDAFIDSIRRSDQSRSYNWYQQSSMKDLGRKSVPSWTEANYDDNSWPSMSIPGYWSDVNNELANGVVWFRREFESDQVGPADLEMGRIVDADSVFVNGTFVGRTTYQYPPRRYKIPDGVLKKGTNSIVVRVINNSGKGGFIADKAYEIRFPDQKIDLSGKWKYKFGTSMPPLAGPTFIRWKPGGLFNAMISPLLNLNIKGAIWYQGESNANNSKQAYEYRDLLSDLIKDWRLHFEQDDFPFITVQLVNFMAARQNPQPSNWAILRESQLLSLKEPNTALVVGIDLGEWNDIHPLNKKDVGKRLALGALNKAYDQDITYSGPLYVSGNTNQEKMILTFDHVGGGLTVKGDQLNGFAIAGENKAFVWANAKIVGDKIEVWHPDVKRPLAVRYGWADNPDKVNLYNKEGLPASPFRTDDWKE